MIKINTNSAQETIDCGKAFAKSLKRGDVVLFEGALGGGKTTFIKGIMQGLGYKKRVLSPTFTLARQYNVKKMRVNHLDLYRLTAADIAGSELSDYFYPKDAVALIEWGDRAQDLLNKFIKVEFKFVDENKRKISFLSYPVNSLYNEKLSKHLTDI
jgi:tRNA threonylcarbamoyladenosine biosynthesis protein TsaE